MEGLVIALSGCGFAGSLSAGLPLRRVVGCAEEVADRSGDNDRWRLASRVFRCVGMYPPELVRLCRGFGVGDSYGDPSEDLIVGWVCSYREEGWLWLFVVCGVVILRVRWICLICAGRVVCVIGVDGCRVGRVVMVGGGDTIIVVDTDDHPV